MQKKQWNKGVWGGLFLIVVLAGGLRFFQLDRLPLWNDESIQLAGVSMPYDQLVSRHLKGIDHMPPLSYSIQRAFWIHSKTIRAAKAPGAIAGVLMTLLAFFSFRRSDSSLAGLLAAFFTATSFYLIYYSQELRCYIFFGFGLWLFLGTILDILLTPLDKRVSVFQWLLLTFGAILAGSFHYATQLVLPPTGACGMLAMSVYLLENRSRLVVREWILRILWMGLSLVVALGICYFEMKYFMGGKLHGMMDAVKDSSLPPLSLMADVFARFAWGSGWRMVCFGAVVTAGALFAGRKERIAMLFAASLCLTAFLLCFYVYPKLGQRPASMMSVRYMFWTAWCVMILLSSSVYALLMRFRRYRLRFVVPASLLAVYLACLAPAFWHYYQMDAKRMNIRTAKIAVEAIRPDRLLLLGNAYDMHHLQAEWPTNCTYAALPVFENDQDFERLHLGDLMMLCARSYPNIVFKKSSYERSLAMEAFDQLSEVLTDRIVVDNDLHAERLYEMGLNPMIGRSMEYAYLSEESLKGLFAAKGSDLMLYPGCMPLIITQNGRNYVPWRLLQKPLDFTLLHSGEPKVLRIKMSSARIGNGGVRVDFGTGSKTVAVAPTAHQVFDSGENGWVHTQLSLQQVAAIGGRIPVQLAEKMFEFDLSVVDGVNHFRLTPLSQPTLLAPPQVEYCLQK